MSSAKPRPVIGSLSFRLNAWYMAVLTLVFALAAFGAHAVVRRDMDRDEHLRLQTELGAHRMQLEVQGLDGFDAFVAGRLARSTVRWFVRVSDRSGRTLAAFMPSSESGFAGSDLSPRRQARTIISQGPEGPRSWLVAATLTGGGLWLQIGLDHEPHRQLFGYLERGLWVLLGLGLVLATVGGFFVSRRALAPLRTLTRTSHEIVRSGNLAIRVPLRGVEDELDQLSAEFNRVLERNQRLVDSMRQALDNVAHDLRTPLSRLRSGAELALHHEHDPARMRDALAECVEESERVLSTLHALMDVSEAEAGLMRLRQDRVDLAELARDTLDIYEHVAEERGVVLELQTDNGTIVRADRLRLAQAAANLVDNAVKYTDRGGKVEVAVRRSGHLAQLVVTDTGIGIEPVHLDKIWQRLYRADASRTRGGLGLGLSFVKAIVEAHGGAASVTSTPGRGSQFVIELPLLNAPSSS